ncbi:MAG: adenylate/guanylate cyclase domain-containing protein [Actinomycetota bacterium]|nr:adenylate/guanylate cyclase domain-containing protein [Actinomycetota bacterium]
MRSDLPSGTVTFLFTDVEGSTKLLHELGAEGYAGALAEHRRVLREAFQAHKGVEVDTQGDAFFVAFPTAPGALAAVREMLAGLASGSIRVRMGLHTGTPFLAEEGYVGPDVNRAARIAACGHGGQVLVSASTAQLVELELTDLGEHRLKDLSAPERIFQLGDGEFPALKSLYRTNLPVPATTFLGREGELAEVLSLLAREDTRLLTLTGPGGTGKTRLALQAAAEASDAFPDGVFWVPLAPLRDPTLVLETMAQAVGSQNGLAEHIQDKEMLCLFDNFEQVVEAGAELADLLAACPNLDVLVTSRERLRVRGEQTYPVPPLAESDGEALFTARARAVEPSFASSEAVPTLCVRLDQLPLALELAAARTALFSPEQLLERLSQRLDLLKGERDADPRQQTLRATIEWSYDLLSGEEQRLFSHLSVFTGGCTYEAAEEIAGADPDTLQSLLDKSLLRKRESKLGPRYWMLETIREYAVERLEDAEVRRRHAEHFLALAEDAEPHLVRDAGWLDRLDVEVDNVRSALDFAAAVGQTQPVLRATAALDDFWFTRGYVWEGWTRLENALAADPQPTAARCRALIAASSAAVMSGNEGPARARVEEALVIGSALGDVHLRALARYEDACLLTAEEKWAAALEILEDVVPVLRGLRDWDIAIRANRTRAWMYEELGDMARFWALTEENLEHAREHGHRRIEARSLGALSVLAESEGRFGDAHALLSQSCQIDLELGNLPFLSVDLVRFALVSARRGRPGVAAQLLARAATLRDEIGYTLESWMTLETEEALAAVRAQLDDSTLAAAWQQGAKLSLDEAIALALDSEPDA